MVAPEHGFDNSDGLIVLRLVWMWAKRKPNNESPRQERERTYESEKWKILVFSTYIQHCIVVNGVYTSSNSKWWKKKKTQQILIYLLIKSVHSPIICVRCSFSVRVSTIYLRHFFISTKFSGYSNPINHIVLVANEEFVFDLREINCRDLFEINIDDAFICGTSMKSCENSKRRKICEFN